MAKPNFGALDLDKVASILKGHPNYNPFRSALRFAKNAQSAMRDLQECQHLLKLLHGLHEATREGTEDKQKRDPMLHRALFGHAIITYGRVAFKDGGTRGLTYLIPTRDEPELWHKLKDIKAVRDKIIAHHEGDDPTHTSWRSSRATVILRPYELYFSNPHRAFNYRGESINDLFALTDFAIPRAIEKHESADAEMAKYLQEAFMDASLQERLISEAKFDPLEYYGDAKLAELYWEGELFRTDTEVTAPGTVTFPE